MSKDDVPEARVRVAIAPNAIDERVHIEYVRDARAGAISVFVGTTRDTFRGEKVQKLSYECYEPMALRELRAIADELVVKYAGDGDEGNALDGRGGHGIRAIDIAHRVGDVGAGETSVVVAVASAHRKDAQDACAEAMEALKARVPIWKKEIFEGILMDDALALELGANILGSVSDVFINADGYKKSIAGPGAGNYLTVAKAAAAARSIVGERALRERSIVQAHGTGTPQNRVSESAILNRVAKEFGIQGWRIAAVKAFVGHSLASSAGDQLMSTLGLWAHGTIPGIETVTELADDVKRDNLDFVLKHRESDAGTIDVALLNSKGFGGNNASATVLAPHITQKILAARHGQKAMTDYFHHNEAIAANSNDYDAAASRGDHRILYHFDDGVLGEEALAFGATTTGRCASVQVGENRPPINLDLKSPYAGLAD